MPDMDGVELTRRIRADAALAGVAVILLTAFGMREDAERAREAGVLRCLTKPVRASLLHDALHAALGREADLPAAHAPAGRVVEPLRPGIRVLLAEDNPVNQDVASRQLARLGIEAHVAGNGREAVEALARASYDVVLMDCYMPEMDGFAATAEIRRRETGIGRHTPIVAMTASALAGDRERCLRAGMDDYVSKPGKREKRREVPAHWAGAAAGPNAPGAAGEARTVDSCTSGTRPPGGSADQTRERRPRLPERPLVPHPLEVVRDDLGLVPAAVAPALERAEDRAQGQDALTEERAVHRPERHALHVRDLHRMDAAGSVAPDRREEPPLPARVEEVEHVPPAPARRPCQLARVRERVDERQVLAQRMDHLDRETDAGGRRLGKETRVGVTIGARGRLPGSAVPAAADDEERVAVQAVHPLDGAPDLLDALADRTPLGPEPAVRAHVRDLERRRAQEPDRPLHPVRAELRAREADRPEAEPLQVPHVLLERPPPQHVVADREALVRLQTGQRSPSHGRMSSSATRSFGSPSFAPAAPAGRR